MAIDIGNEAVDLGEGEGFDSYTGVVLDNPANADGTLNVVEVFSGGIWSAFKVGTFFGSGTSQTSRSFANLGALTSGKISFSGLSINVSSGDFIGFYGTGEGAFISKTTGVAGTPYYSGDGFTGSEITMTAYNIKVALCGTGTETAAGQPFIKRFGGVPYAALNRGVF